MENKSSLAYVIRSAYGEFDKYVLSQNVTNLCITDCNKCCRDYFYISEYEFLYILKFIEEHKMDKQKYIFLSREYAIFFNIHHPDKFSELEKYMATSNQIIADNDKEQYYDLPLCLFWEKEKGCSIYQSRPSVCRWYGSCTSCQFIGNEDIGRDSIEKLCTLTSIAHNKKNNKILAHRAYPIFYWFYKFLSPSYTEITNKKLKLFSFASEEKLTAFELSLQ